MEGCAAPFAAAGAGGGGVGAMATLVLVTLVLVTLACLILRPDSSVAAAVGDIDAKARRRLALATGVELELELAWCTGLLISSEASSSSKLRVAPTAVGKACCGAAVTLEVLLAGAVGAAAEVSTIFAAAGLLDRVAIKPVLGPAGEAVASTGSAAALDCKSRC